MSVSDGEHVCVRCYCLLLLKFPVRPMAWHPYYMSVADGEQIAGKGNMSVSDGEQFGEGELSAGMGNKFAVEGGLSAGNGNKFAAEGELSASRATSSTQPFQCPKRTRIYKAWHDITSKLIFSLRVLEDPELHVSQIKDLIWMFPWLPKVNPGIKKIVDGPSQQELDAVKKIMDGPRDLDAVKKIIEDLDADWNQEDH